MEEKVRVNIRTDKSEYAIGEKIRVYIDILNLNSNPLRLTFNSAQRYDFIVFRGHQEVWRWSTDKMFAMLLNSITLKPNKKEEFTETLYPQFPKGEYKLVGIVTSKPPYKTSCLFKIK